MFTITTATGKQFNSDYAVENSAAGIAFVSILGKGKNEVEAIFNNPAELPLDCFPEYNVLGDVLNTGSVVKLLLEKGVNP